MSTFTNLVSQFRGRILMVLIAVLSGGFWTGSTTDFGAMLHQATDKKEALAQAAELISETPKAEVVQAVKEEADKPVTVEGTVVTPAK